jgi:lipoate-protein ligase A
MLKIQLEVSGDKIQHVIIMGDFFLHPEETVQVLEEKLRGVKVKQEILSKAIQDVLDENDALLIGAKAADIAKAIEMAK